MPMTRERKQQEVDDLKARFESQELVVVAHNLGLSASEAGELRAALRKEGASFKTTKNTLAKLAVKGTKFEGLGDLFAGPTGVATSEDPVVAAKVAHNFAKTHKKFVILGGSLGSQVLDVAGVEALAKLPSLDELRSKIIGVILAPATKVAGVVQAPAGQLARVVGAYAAKGE